MGQQARPGWPRGARGNAPPARAIQRGPQRRLTRRGAAREGTRRRRRRRAAAAMAVAAGRAAGPRGPAARLRVSVRCRRAGSDVRGGARAEPVAALLPPRSMLPSANRVQQHRAEREECARGAGHGRRPGRHPPLCSAAVRRGARPHRLPGTRGRPRSIPRADALSTAPRPPQAAAATSPHAPQRRSRAACIHMLRRRRCPPSATAPPRALLHGPPRHPRPRPYCCLASPRCARRSSARALLCAALPCM